MCGSCFTGLFKVVAFYVECYLIFHLQLELGLPSKNKEIIFVSSKGDLLPCGDLAEKEVGPVKLKIY